MKEEERLLREHVSRLVYTAGIFGLRDDGLEELFVRGEVDPLLAEIGIDSLAEMELCIAIEKELGLSLAPADLQRLGSLGKLVDRIKKA